MADKVKTRSSCVLDFLKDDPNPPKMGELKAFTEGGNPLSSYYEQIPDRFKVADEPVSG